ncbi:hypothetical protein [Spiroplasma poulsonii]|nr:hypothetical protein [Spiroplasma poulsonii]
MVKVLQHAYKDGIDNHSPIGMNAFFSTLQNTYENQTTLKQYLLAAIENAL